MVVHDEQGLDVVVRFHDIGRIRELDRCLFSLAGQTYRPLTVIVVCQRFTVEQVVVVEQKLQEMLDMQPQASAQVINFTDDEPSDARSILINTGISAAVGRYLAFLDYDDTIYAEGYSTLIEELRSSGNVAAFGSVASKFVSIYDDVMITIEKKLQYHGNGVMDLFVDNFCPLHSYVIDRSKLSPSELYFDTSLAILEDYDFLLRVCSRYRVSFAHGKRLIGDYYFKDDGSNTTLLSSTATLNRRARWDTSRNTIRDRKTKMAVSLAVQRSLDLPDTDVGYTIQDIVNLRVS